jgi:hypothetical protein
MRYVAAITCLALAGLAGPGFAGVERTLEQDYSTADVDEVYLDISVAEIEIRGVSGDRLRAQVEIECSAWRGERCRRQAEDIELNSRVRNDELILELEGYPKNSKGLSVDILIEMPRDLRLSVDMGVGELAVEDLESDIVVDLGVGELDIEGHRAHYREVDLESGVGEVELRVDGDRYQGSGFISQDLRWDDGPGRSRIRADCGVGEIQVRLR